MAKHITKSVIEDIACELKRLGLIFQAYEENRPTEEMISSFGDKDEFHPTGTEAIDWLTTNFAEILNGHDPKFDYKRFTEIAKYKYEY